MSIRAIAKDLYRADLEVRRLEEELKEADPMRTERLNGELRTARRELTMIRKILEGEKESGETRKKFQGFGK